MTATEAHPVLHGSPYQAYVYAYPHKTAYRRLTHPRPLREVWANERRNALFLYLHIPFCTMRCGFCNLFTTPNPKGNLVTHYLDTLRRQANLVREALPDAKFARLAIGGGTPTFLNETELGELFDIAEQVMGDDPHAIPTGIETSPDTLTPSKVRLLRDRGVERVSIGVQSFIEGETRDCGRPQTRAEIDTALSLLAGAGFPCVNIDLIYGLPGQTVESWLYSIRESLQFKPHELYLYPLYVRPLTGLGRSHKEWDDIRLACYRAGCDFLLSAGYEQVSMRMFRITQNQKTPQPQPTAAGEGASHLAYCCQTDGMVGLGCGARSYTRELHYSFDYAVGPKDVKSIIAEYVARTSTELAVADHGFVLDANEQRRRYLLQSILNVEGLSTTRYTARFGTDATDEFPELLAFAELGLVRFDEGKWVPTALGLERSDALGPRFFSRHVNALMAEYEPK